MSIRAKDGGWQIDVTVRDPINKGKYKRKKEKFYGSKPDAEQRAADIEAALRGNLGHMIGNNQTLKCIPLSDALETVWTTYWKGKAVEKTNRYHMNEALDFFGFDRDISSITTDDADGYVLMLKNRDLKPSSIRSKVTVVNKMYNHYHRRGKISGKPHFELPKMDDNTRDRVVSETEFETLLRLFSEEHDRLPRRSDGQNGQAWADWVAFQYDTGIRPKETRHVNVTHLRDGLLTLRITKSGKIRTVPLTDRALAALQRQAFVHGNKPFEWATKDAIRHAWNWARKEMKLLPDDDFVPYVLRHTCASRLYAKTCNLLLVKDWLGHADIKTTLRYAKLNPTALMDARDRLQEDEMPKHKPKLRAV